MHRLTVIPTVALALAAGLALTGCKTEPEATTDPDELLAMSVDPRVEGLLRAMSDRMSEEANLAFHVDITYGDLELVDAASGTMVTIEHTARSEFTVSRPDMLRVSYDGDRERREFFLDGQTATMLAPVENVYAVIPSPGTIEETLDALWDSAGVAPPLADFVYRDPYSRLAPTILGAWYVGLHDIDGSPCHHVALTQETMDWQVWIDAVGDPLPRRVVMSYREDPTTSSFAADFGGWDFESTAPPTSFHFEAPAGAIKVDAVATPSTGSDDGDDR